MLFKTNKMSCLNFHQVIFVERFGRRFFVIRLLLKITRATTGKLHTSNHFSLINLNILLSRCCKPLLFYVFFQLLYASQGIG